MTCLRVADVDSVEQNSYLLVVAAPYANVGLCSYRTTLPHIDGYELLQQVVYTLYRRRLNILSAQYSYHSRLLTLGQRCSRARHAHLFQLHLSLVQGRIGRHLVGIYAYSGCRCVLQRGHAERADDDFLAKTGEEGITFSGEVGELQHSALVESWFVHDVIEKKRMQRYEKKAISP